MRTVISNNIYVYNCTKELFEWVENNLIVKNPTYETLMRIGKQDQIIRKHISEKMRLFVVKNGGLFSNYYGDVVIPFGCLNAVWKFIKDSPYELKLNSNDEISCKKDLITQPLFDYQEEAVKKMVAAKGGILIGGTGSGKTNCGIEIIHRIGKKFLWLTHTKDLVRQSYERMKKLYPNMKIGTVGDGKIEFGVDGTIATVQTMVTLDKDLYKNDFDTIVVDECFPAGTSIITKSGKKNIEEIKVGDYVLSYNHKDNKLEFKKVNYLFQKTSSMLHSIKVDDKILTSTKNHPVFTQRGYIQMEDIKDGDYVLQVLSKASNEERPSKKYLVSFKKEGLHFLQQGMYDESKEEDKLDSGNETKNVRKDDLSKLQSSTFSKKTFTDENTKSNDGFNCSQQNDRNQKKKWNIEFTNQKQRWKREDFSLSRNAKSRITKNGLKHSNGISNSNQKNNRTNTSISNLLQSGYSNSRINDCYRNRWAFSLWRKSKNERYEEESILVWKRVESIQNIQQENTQGCERSCTVYNLEVEDNNNYFANDILVHNCHHVSGSPELMKMFAKVVETIPARYKYGITASEKRNDSLTKTIYTILGTDTNGEFAPVWRINREDTNALTAEHIKIELDTPFSYDMLNADGTFNYVGLVDYLANCEERNKAILDKIEEIAADSQRKQLVLCTRKSQCELLHQELLQRGIASELLIGKVSSKKRETILKEKVDWQVVVATVSLAKEGLDLPNLNTLHLASCIGNESDTIQSVGRIERFKENKPQPWAFDYVDVNIPYLVSRYKKRVNWLRKRR